MEGCSKKTVLEAVRLELLAEPKHLHWKKSRLEDQTTALSRPTKILTKIQIRPLQDERAVLSEKDNVCHRLCTAEIFRMPKWQILIFFQNRCPRDCQRLQQRIVALLWGLASGTEESVYEPQGWSISGACEALTR